MITDAQNQFSDEQAVTAAAASENVIDLGTFLTADGVVAAERRIGTGERLYIVLNVDELFADAGSDSELVVTLQADDNEGFSSPATIQTLGTFPAVSVPGETIKASIDPEKLTQRFIRLFYTPTNGDLSAGKVTANVVHGIDAFTAYPDNSTITG